jgi:hypothetical protein
MSMDYKQFMLVALYCYCIMSNVMQFHSENKFWKYLHSDGIQIYVWSC